MAKILIVEDDTELAEKVREWLVHDRYVVDVVHRGNEATDYLSIYQYDAIILDWELPDTTGIDVLKQYRNSGGKSPVLMLTGKKEIDDKEIGFDSGADDYLTKPFHFQEVSARIRALLRRPAVFAGNKLKAGNVILEMDRRSVTRDGEPIHLSPLEFALLELFIRYPSKVFSHEALLDRVWSSDSTASVDTVRTCIKALRKKIGSDNEPSIIRTVHGVGYRLELD